MIDFPEARVEPLRTVKRRGPRPVEDVRAVPLRDRDRDRDETEFQRVGGRHRFRPEVLLVMAGSLFLAAALLKPWPSGPPARSSSGVPTATTDPATGAETSAAAALQSPVGWPDVPHWHHDRPVAGASQPTPQQGNSGSAADGRWSAVDWRVLSTSDPHGGWGYGTATMPDLAAVPSGSTIPSPATTWIAVGAAGHTTISVDRGTRVFGLAVTWPHNIHVTSVTVEYIGGPDHPANMPPAGFPAYAQVSPLPAAQVASGSQGAAVARATTPHAAGAGGTLGSGSFWIPPSAASDGASSATIADAWRSQPWPWPSGTYTVTITSAMDVTKYLLTLQAG